MCIKPTVFPNYEFMATTMSKGWRDGGGILAITNN